VCKTTVKQILIGSIFIIGVFCTYVQAKDSAYVGQWDSSIYNLMDHPKTVCLRVEVLDSETRLPIANAQVSFKGVYMTEERTSRHPEGEQRTQEEEYELITSTDKDGIVVAALSWKKEYPWRYGTDEIEKVQLIEIVRRGYRFAEQDVPFKRFLDIGQNKDSDSQEPKFFDMFEKAWAKECALKDVKLCTPRFNKDFPDFKNKKSKHPALFEKILNKEWGIVYKGPINRMQWEDQDKILCGPYLIYTIKVYMDRTEDSDQRRDSRQRSDNGQKKNLDRIPDSLLMDNTHKATASSPEISKKTPQGSAEDCLETVTESLVREMGLPLGTKGVAVKRVIANSIAAKAGIRPNMVIESIDSRIILDVEMLTSKITNKTDDDQVLISIWQQGPEKWERANMIVYVSAIRSLYFPQVPKEGVENIKEEQALLEFRICPILSEASKEDRTKIANYLDYFKQHGPVLYNGTPEYLWKEIYNKEGFNCREAVIEEYKGRSYLLTSNDTKKIHIIKNNTSNWPISNLRETKDYRGRPALEFSLDEREGRQLWLITKRNINSPMAIIVGNKVINAPYISSPIRSNISISGHGIGRSSELISLLTPLLSRVKTPANSSEPLPQNDEVAFAKQVISALANNNEMFFQERRITPEDWGALVECESFQKELSEELDDGQTIEDLKQEFIAIFQQQERIKEYFHTSFLEVQSDLHSKGINLRNLKIIKCYTEEFEFHIELEGDHEIYEFRIEAVRLPRGWVVLKEIDKFSTKSILR